MSERHEPQLSWRSRVSSTPLNRRPNAVVEHAAIRQELRHQRHHRQGPSLRADAHGALGLSTDWNWSDPTSSNYHGRYVQIWLTSRANGRRLSIFTVSYGCRKRWSRKYQAILYLVLPHMPRLGRQSPNILLGQASSSDDSSELIFSRDARVLAVSIISQRSFSSFLRRCRAVWSFA